MSAWVAPITWTSGQTVTASQMNANVRDTTTWLKAFADLVSNSTAADSGTATYISITRATATTAYRTLVTGDTVNRFTIDANGDLSWGPGDAAVDVTLKRSEAGVLRIDGRLALYRDATSIGFAVTQTGDTSYRFTALGNGTLQWGNGTDAVDTNLYRAEAGVLMTDDVLKVNNTSGLMTIGTGNTIMRNLLTASDSAASFQIMHSNGEIRWGAGGSTAYDTNLYRSAANRLKTDDLIDASPMGVATFVKAGSISDSDWGSAPPIGTIAIDTTNFKIYIRTGSATWKSSAAFT